MLLEKEDIALAKLIGFVNGVENEADPKMFEGLVIEVLDNLKAKTNLDEMINKLVEAKKEFLPNCLTCTSPCGRTNDYHLNNLSEEEFKEKINIYNELLDTYQTIEYSEVIYLISKISW